MYESSNQKKNYNPTNWIEANMARRKRIETPVVNLKQLMSSYQEQDIHQMNWKDN